MNNYPIATILGGGGFIGRYLVRKMTEKNFQCIIPTRNAYLKGYLKTQAPPGAIEFIDFNPKDFSKIKEAINNSDIVINLIGILFENRKQKFANMHSDLPGLIAKYCSETEVLSMNFGDVINKLSNEKLAVTFGALLNHSAKVPMGVTLWLKPLQPIVANLQPIVAQPCRSSL